MTPQERQETIFNCFTTMYQFGAFYIYNKRCSEPTDIRIVALLKEQNLEQHFQGWSNRMKEKDYVIQFVPIINYAEYIEHIDQPGARWWHTTFGTKYDQDMIKLLYRFIRGI